MRVTRKFFGRNSRLFSLERPSGKSEVAIQASRDRATASSGCTVPVSIRMSPRHSKTAIKDKPVSDQADRAHRARFSKSYHRFFPFSLFLSLFLSRLLSSQIHGKDRDGSLHRIPADLKFEKGRGADDDGSIHAHWFSSLVSSSFLPNHREELTAIPFVHSAPYNGNHYISFLPRRSWSFYMIITTYLLQTVYKLTGFYWETKRHIVLANVDSMDLIWLSRCWLSTLSSL